MAALLLTGCDTGSGAQETTDTTAGPGDAPSSQEQLIAQPPEGWEVWSAAQDPGLRVAQYVPPDTDAENWEQMLRMESMSGDPLPDPIEFLTALGRDQAEGCGQSSDLNIHSGAENNYSTSVRLFSCRNDAPPNLDQVTLIKAIRANDNFYVIALTRRATSGESTQPPVSDAEMAVWAAYMRTVTVCDPTRPEHPCPTPTPEPPAPAAG
ncbi:MAG: hypothetical protein GWM88_17360 [Pseudomonadales bacterium]|nr:hypothetical protein [Pseudomonadales bacterium]NIX09702.1 hypothetical protein [Pseudomonadales bacterium]